MTQFDKLAFAAAVAYLGAKYMIDKRKKAALGVGDVVMAAQIYIVITKLRSGSAPVIEVPQAKTG